LYNGCEAGAPPPSHRDRRIASIVATAQAAPKIAANQSRHCQREATAKRSERRERDQLVQAWVHLRRLLIEFHDAVQEEKIERRPERVESVLVDRKLTFRVSVFSCFTARVTSRAEES
jgi:hypothetical protein